MTGHNSVRMADLTALYIGLGLKDAETYIQSGNVIFSDQSSMQKPAFSINIEQAILEKFGYIVPVMIRTLQELNDLFASNPYLIEPDFDPAKMAVIFLHDKPSDGQIKKVEGVNYPPDRFKIAGKDIHIYCPNGFGKTKIYTSFFEKKMGVVGTGRNWKTITAILEIAEKKQLSP